MLNLIIVDDEKTTRDSLESYIPWKELGIDRVATAKNGVAALELAEKLPPDIILSDVRMPKMDGIELAINIRLLYPDCKIIFLSGYSDKEYLMSAINLKAVSYIEKPIQIDEIKAVILETVALCNEEKEKKAHSDKIVNILNENEPLILQDIALGLIKDSPDTAAITEKYEDIFKGLSEEARYTVFSINLWWLQSVNNDIRTDCRRKLLKALNCARDLPFTVLAGFTNEANIVVITARATDEELTDIQVSKILQTLIVPYGADTFSLSIGIGSTGSDITALQASYSSALSAAKKQFYYDTRNIFEYSELTGSTIEIDKSIYPQFKDFLKRQDIKGAVNIVLAVNNIAAEKKDIDVNKVKNIFFNLLLVIFEVARENHYINKTPDNEKKYIWLEIDAIPTLSSLKKYVLSHLETLLDRSPEKDSVSRKLHVIMKFVHENYSQNSLTIQDIARNVFLSETYLCAFFKKATGKTLNEYITEVRIEKSKELLKDSNIKLYEVATRIGFSDANYFSTLFKKYTSCTPSEFRERVSL